MEKGYWEQKLLEAGKRQIDKDDLSRQFAEYGRKGGSQPKIKFPIVVAIAKYLYANKKTNKMSNEQIARGFCKKYNSEDEAMKVRNEVNKWEVFCTEVPVEDGNSVDYLISMVADSRHSAEEKSIAYTTLRNRYIPEAKRLLQDLKTSDQP
jgi:hypothetical protein